MSPKTYYVMRANIACLFIFFFNKTKIWPCFDLAHFSSLCFFFFPPLVLIFLIAHLSLALYLSLYHPIALCSITLSFWWRGRGRGGNTEHVFIKMSLPIIFLLSQLAEALIKGLSLFPSLPRSYCLNFFTPLTPLLHLKLS